MNDLSIYSIRDYRRFFSAHFQFLKGLCGFSNVSVTQSVQKHLSSLLVSSQLLSMDSFEASINQTINRIKFNTPVAFNRLLSLISMKNYGDSIISTYGTNYQYQNPAYNGSKNSLTFTQPLIYDDNCSCSLNRTCTIDATFQQQEMRTIAGLRMGCIPSESFLASTLECFFNSSCIALLDNMANFTRTGSLPPLNSTDSRYAVNITVNDLVNELFVENWLTQMSYSEYFKKCSPMLCSFTYVQQFNLMYTITYLLGLLGGLTIVLKWITPKMVSVFRKTFQICAQQNHRVEPISRIQTTHIEIHVKSRTVTEPYVSLFSPTKLHPFFYLSRETCSLKWFHYLMFYSVISVIALIFILTPTIYLIKRREQSH